MEDFIPESCRLSVKVQLKVPLHTKKLMQRYNKSIESEDQNIEIVEISVINFNRSQFKYDATWFTKQFHTLDAIWSQQRVIVLNKISTILTDAFLDATKNVRISPWTENKFISFQEQIDAVTTPAPVVTTNNINNALNLQDNNYGIDSGLLPGFDNNDK